MHQVLNRQRNLILSLKVLFIPFPHTNRLSEAERLQTVNITLFFRFHISLRPVEEKAMAPYSSTLARKIPWTEKLGRLQSRGWQRIRHDWVTSFSLFTFMHWRRKWQPTPVFLPENPMDGGACGLPSMGSHRVGYDWSDLAAAAAEANWFWRYREFNCHVIYSES